MARMNARAFGYLARFTDVYEVFVLEADEVPYPPPEHLEDLYDKRPNGHAWTAPRDIKEPGESEEEVDYDR